MRWFKGPLGHKKYNNIHIIGIPEEKREDKGLRLYLKK